MALHLLSSSVPHVRHVPLPAEGEPAMPLLHAAPWSRLLTAVGSGGARIGAAIETLRPTHYDGVAPDVHQRRCGLGAALRATLAKPTRTVAPGSDCVTVASKSEPGFR